VIHTDAPYYFRRPDAAMSEEQFSAQCAAHLEELIEREGADTIGAFIGEPLLGTGGIVPPPAGYWEAIQPILKKHDILLIVDEVVTGFGRLGTMMGSTHYGLTPDIITIAKGLTSAYAPLSGSIVSDDSVALLEEGTDRFGPFGHGWTYSAHPISAAAGIANLKLVDPWSGRRTPATRGAISARRWPRRWQATALWATCAATGCWQRWNCSATPAHGVDFDPADKDHRADRGRNGASAA
jgi:L-2,4-diaminobutyrate transaminase